MRASLTRTFIIIGVVLALAAACLLFVALPTERAEAASYSVGSGISVNLDYGAEPHYPYFYNYASGKYFKVVSYNVVLQEGPLKGAIVSLLTDGRVTMSPGSYVLPASDNTALCDEHGALVTEEQNGGPITDVFEGSITVVVQKNVLPVTVSAASLVKVYGDTASDVTWVFKEESDRDPSIEITFSSTGFAPTAHVGEHPIQALSVTKGGEDVTALYDVSLHPEAGEGDVTFTVSPRDITFTLSAKDTVEFNHWLLADGESVTTLVAEGANGETLTAYYRLKDTPQGVLTVGESYEVEAHYYTVGSTRYAIGDPSDYSPSFVYEENAVLAGKGTLIVYTDPSLIESREGDLFYLYHDFTCDYLDPAVTLEGAGECAVGVEYFGRDLILYCNIAGDVKKLSSGEYPITFSQCVSDDFYSIAFEEGVVTLRVNKRVLVYDGEDSAEVASGDTFVKRVSVAYNDKEYYFDLTADVAGQGVGDTTSYASAAAVTDGDFDLDFSTATVTMVKRTTGVTVSSLVGDRVYYGYDEPLAALKVDGQIAEGRIEYAYSASGSSVRTTGTPVALGSYVVYCTLVSDVYQVAEASFSLTVESRPVAAYFVLTTASKVYGTSFDFSSANNVRLERFYSYDAQKKKVDRERSFSLSGVTLGGTSLTSAGAAASAVAGSYSFDYSGILTTGYTIMTAIYYDNGAKREVTSFTVTKAAAPAAPTVNAAVSGRSVRVTVSPLPSGRAELSLSSDFSGKTSVSVSGGTASFTGLTCGAAYYLRVRAEDSANYLSPSEWTVVQKTIAIPFAAPVAEITSVGSDTVSFKTEEAEDAVEGYEVQYRVGTSEVWREGEVVTGLIPDHDYNLYFRFKNAVTSGATAHLAVRTLRAPVEEGELTLSYDRAFGELTVTTQSENLEYRLVSASGEYLTEWIGLADMPLLDNDTKYTLLVRIAATDTKAASEIREIALDTHEVKQPLTLRSFLSDWFLIVIAVGLLLVAAILLFALIKKKKKADREELGG